jgi:hypothetical protein
MQEIVSHYTNVLTREFNTFISDTAIRQVNNATWNSWDAADLDTNNQLISKSDKPILLRE